MVLPFAETLRNASIRTKLTTALGAMLVLLVAIGLLGLLQLGAVHRVTKELREVRLPQIETLQLIKHLAFEHKLLASRRMQTTNFHYLAAISSAMDETQKALQGAKASYLARTDRENQGKLFEQFQRQWADYLRGLDLVTRQLEVGETDEAVEIFKSIARTAFDSASETLEQIIDLAREKSAEATGRADAVFRLAFILTLGALLLSALFALASLLWITRNISAPILRVADAMKRLTAGDETVVLPGARGSGGEIGVLIDAATGYRDALLRSRDLAEAAELERQRLYAAVNNMPVGLSMFDRDERLVICNNLYREMYHLSTAEVAPGTTLAEIIQRRADRGGLLQSDLPGYRAKLISAMAKENRVLEVFDLNDGRSISMTLQPLPAGGWVALHEDITSRREAEDRIRHMAHHDGLTDLPNRLTLQTRIAEGLTNLDAGESIAVLSLDLDRFKAVNDTLGHATGDTLLTIVAKRLLGCVREHDTVARFGGDEFAIVQIGAEQPEAATSLARRVIEALSTPYEIDSREIVIGVSVGISVAPGDGADPETLLKNSDMALYRAKNDGRGMFHFFEPTMDARMQARRALELDLRKALVEGQFEMFYQPVVNLDRDEVTSLEALLRWHCPARGMVSPADFIPIAEEIGLIIPLGEWVLHQACQDAVGWPGEVKVSVNLSPVQFQSARLLDAVKSALATSGLKANRLELEITEGVLLAETEATLAILQQLHALGVQIAMDDFGTGYSGLSYFRSFHFDRVKIDRSFISNITDDESSLAIIRAVAGLSASLGMSTTAEGVETDEQLQRLRAEGCKEFQGYLFSPPRPASDVPAILAARGQLAVTAA